MPLAVAESSKFFDTLKESFTEEQAKNLTQVLALISREPPQSRMATRRDVETLVQPIRQDIKELEQKNRLDIERLRQSTQQVIEALRQSTQQAIEALRLSTKEEIKALEKSVKELELSTKQEIKALEKSIAKLDVRIVETKVEVLKWTVGFLLAQTGVFAALVKLL